MFPSFCRVVVEFIYSEAEEKLPNLDTQIEEVQCLVEALSALGEEDNILCAPCKVIMLCSMKVGNACLTLRTYILFAPLVTVFTY